MDWHQIKATTCVADVGVNQSINYAAMYILLTIDPIDLSRCIIKKKNIIRHDTPEGSIIFAGWKDFKRGVPHRFTESSNFKNATSLSMSLGEGRYASLAVYTNKVHICGCKQEKEIRACINHLLQKLYVINEALTQVTEHKDALIQYMRDNFKGPDCTSLGYDLHSFQYDRLKFYKQYGLIAQVLDPYLMTVKYLEDAVVFIEWCTLIGCIVPPCKMSYIDYHNINYDMNLGFKVDLASLAYLARDNNFTVEYSNVNDAYVHIVVPYEELDESTTKRKKSRFVINIYKTGAVKLYGPNFRGIQKEFDKFHEFVQNNADLLRP
jgi:hypothetical protein